ncbi:probable RNA-binding protein 19 [Phlebotomus argentipes]|uniref:probable RNA-binding protein 19 n=1 Tax=Phlebotomus argentipes TaxID=94469 RepID=UPI0028932F45|nr:probable RNA-binding protein 19 [Phlebotomus argentipes]
MSRLIVKDLPKKINEQRIRELFGQKGRVTDVQLKHTQTGVFRRFCFVGYQTDDEAQAALEHFNKSFVDTSRITVELCAPLGKATKGRKKEEEPAEEPAKEKKKQHRRKGEKEEEIIKEYKDDPEFQEFLKVHKVGKKTVWDNDTSIGDRKDATQAPESPDDVNESGNEEGDASGDEDNKDVEEMEEKVADKAISDLEYMKSLMQKPEKAPKAPKAPQEAKKKLKGSEKEKDINFFTLKMFNLPYNTKRGDILKFFKPLKPKSVRIPIKEHGYCYVGFQDKKDMTKALAKHKSFMKANQVFVVDFTDNNRKTLQKKLGLMEDEKNSDKNPKWEKQRQSLASEESISESGKIYFRNLTYSVTEEDIQKLFETYGPVAEVNLPVDSHTRAIKGFGTVTFMLPEHAIMAFNELDGQAFHGRMLHLLPAKADKEKTEEAEDNNTGSYKQKKEQELKKSAGLAHNWNTLFLGANAVAEILAKNYSTTKEHVLDSATGGSSAAVRLALGETQIVSELRQFLEENGVRLEAFEESKGKKIRSKNVILAKNLPAHTEAKELNEIFGKFGVLGRIVLPPSGVTALIEFVEPSEAKKAFMKLAYSKFKDAPLYLEWAPENIFLAEGEKAEKPKKKVKDEPQDFKREQEKAPEVSEEEKSEDEDMSSEDPEPDTTIFLRNLNFGTREEALRRHFSHLKPIHMVQVAMKKDPEDPSSKISLGYGFIQFKRKSSADTALKTMQFTEIEGNRVELKKSDRVVKSQVERKKDTAKQTGSKILVRNIPFQAKESEVRDIFKAFGELRSVRLPLKVTPGEKSHRGFGFVDYFSKSEAKNAFKSLSQSTHLYGRRLVLEWAAADEDVTQLRKRTANHFVDSRERKKSKKSVFGGKEVTEAKEDSDEELTVDFE